MNEENLSFIRELVSDGTIRGPVLELGAGYGGLTSRPAIPPAICRCWSSLDMGEEAGRERIAVERRMEWHRPALSFCVATRLTWARI